MNMNIYILIILIYYHFLYIMQNFCKQMRKTKQKKGKEKKNKIEYLGKMCSYIMFMIND